MHLANVPKAGLIEKEGSARHGVTLPGEFLSIRRDNPTKLQTRLAGGYGSASNCACAQPVVHLVLQDVAEDRAAKAEAISFDPSSRLFPLRRKGGRRCALVHWPG